VLGRRNEHEGANSVAARRFSLTLSPFLLCIAATVLGLFVVSYPKQVLVVLPVVVLLVLLHVFKRTNYLVVIGSVAIGLATFSVGLGTVEGDTSFLVVALLFALIAATLLVKRNEKDMDLFSPFVLTCVGFLLVFGWVGLELVRDSDIPRHLLTHALWYVNLGFILFLVGYENPLGKILGLKVWLPGDNWSAGRIPAAFLTCAILGVSLFFLLTRLAGYASPLEPLQNVNEFRIATSGGLSYLVYLVLFFLQTACLLLLLRVLRMPRTRVLHLLQVLAFVLCVCAVFWLFASRFMFVNLLGGLVICIHYLKRRMKLVEIVGLGFLLALFVSAYGLYRDVGYRWQTTEQVQEELAKLKIRESVLGRLDALARLTTVMQQQPRYDPATVILGILLRPIPRQFAPEKPYGSPAEITRLLWPEAAAGGVTIEPTIFGELYYDFGIFGVIFGLIAYGILIRVLQTYLEGKTRRADFLLHYSLIFLVPIRILLGGFDSGGLTDLIFFTLGSWAVLWYLSRGVPRKLANSAALCVPS